MGKVLWWEFLTRGWMVITLIWPANIEGVIIAGLIRMENILHLMILPVNTQGTARILPELYWGGDASDKYIGVAPGAKWIAAKAWNDKGESTTSTIHEIFQWFMDPDGDPATDDAPDLVNNSWSLEDKLFDIFPCCKLDFRDDITAWRMAGIIPVFSAGNSGPWFFTGESPGNYPETIAVGATDLLDSVAFFSSRGPGNCDLSIFPDITAPGVAILSSAPDGNYRSVSGTSQASPHVAGTIALMLNANPNLNIDEIESVLKTTATPLGFFHPNFTYGWGQLNALEAVSAALP